VVYVEKLTFNSRDYELLRPYPILNESEVDFDMKRIARELLGVLSLAAVLATSTAQAAYDMFLDLGPGIPGESTDATYAGTVTVLAWSWGMSNSGSTHGGSGAAAGKSSFQDLSVTKYVDKASPPLMLRCANGATIPQATLIVRTTGVKPIVALKITLTNVLVTSVSTGGSAGEDRLTENITLNFAQVKFDYVPTNPDGSAGTTGTFSWDLVTNAGP